MPGLPERQEGRALGVGSYLFPGVARRWQCQAVVAFSEGPDAFVLLEDGRTREEVT